MCNVGDTVVCPNSTEVCSGKECCNDGTVCPSAPNSWIRCPKPKSVDCTDRPEPPAGKGCSHVHKLIFKNRCTKDIVLDGWNVNIPAGGNATITGGRPSSERIQWKFIDSKVFHQYDFIELNFDWDGPISPFCGHPSYSNYNGFSMTSQYEALDPWTGRMACAEGGAAVACEPTQGPCNSGDGYTCKGNLDCASPYANWMSGCAHAINPDGSWSKFFKDTTFGQNYVDYMCVGFSDPVATLIGCTAHSRPFDFVITTCNIHPQVSANVTTVLV